MASPTRNASYYLAGATLSYIGTAIVPVAISFAVLDSGHGAGALGLVLAAQTVPTLALLLFAGVAADRRSRRGIMIGADLFRAFAQAVLAAFLILGHAPLVLMVAVAALIGVGNAFFQPASGGFLTEIVSRERLGRTNGLLRMANALAMVIGPALGGAVVATTGPGWGIALDAASYLASATCLLAIGSAAAAAMPGTRPIGHDLSEAWRDMRATRWMVPIVCQYGALNLLAIAPFNVIAPVMLAAASGAVGGAARWATVLSAIGAGAVVGAAACARRQPRKILLGVEAAAAMLSAPLVLLALRAPFALVVAGSALFGVGAAMVSVLTMTAIQKEVAPAQLSRTLAMVQLANIGLLPLGYLLAGTELGLLGPAASLGFGAATTLAGVALLCAQPAIRGLEPRP